MQNWCLIIAITTIIVINFIAIVAVAINHCLCFYSILNWIKIGELCFKRVVDL